MRSGLCPSCRFVRRVVTRRGSEFLFCRRSSNDSRFERYPRQPVHGCPGYDEERVESATDPRADPSRADDPDAAGS